MTLWGNEIKTILRYYHIAIRITEMKNIGNIKLWQDQGTTVIFMYCYGDEKCHGQVVNSFRNMLYNLKYT